MAKLAFKSNYIYDRSACVWLTSVLYSYDTHGITSILNSNYYELNYADQYVYMFKTQPCSQATPSFSMLHAENGKVWYSSICYSACNIEKLGMVWGQSYLKQT